MTHGTRNAARHALLIAAFATLLAVGPGAATRAEEAPSTPSSPPTAPTTTIGVTTIEFNDDILRDLDIALIDVVQTAQPFRAGSMGFAIKSGATLEYTGLYPNNGGFSAGSMHHDGGFTLAFDGLELSIAGFELRNSDKPYAFDLFDTQGKRWFRLASMQHQYSPDGSELRLINADMLLSPEFAEILGRKDLSNSYLAKIDIVIPADLPRRTSVDGTREVPDEEFATAGLACPGPNVGQPADIALTALESAGQLAREPDGRVAISASAQLSNVGNNTVEWFDTIVPDSVDPNDIGPHPFLSLHFYRLSNGRLSQLGQSDTKHAFFTVNDEVNLGDCPCPPGHLIYPGCVDLYGVNLNGQQFHLGPREEIDAFTGAWTRIGSHFDSYDQSTMSINPALTNDQRDHGGPSDHDDSFEHRLVVQEPDIQVQNAQYFFEAWYVVANDSNISNSMGHRQVLPSLLGSTWSLPFLGTDLTSGSILDEFVNPIGTPAGRDTDFVDTGEGRFQVAVRTSNLPNGTFHYEYAVMNFDFSREIGGFSVPLPAGSNVTNPEFVGGSTGTNWGVTVNQGTSITWTAPVNGDLGWGTLFNFAFDADIPAATANVTVAPGSGAALAPVSSIGPDPNGIPPSEVDNDDCANAAPLSLGSTLGSMQDATPDGDSSAEFGVGGLNDVWYTYTPTNTGRLRVNTCRTNDLTGIDTGIDTVLSIHTFCPGTFENEIDSNDDYWSKGSTGNLACDLLDANGDFLEDGDFFLDSAVHTSVTAGVPVLVRVAQFAAGDSPNFVLTVKEPPQNDNVSGAIPLSMAGTTVLPGTLTGAGLAEESEVGDFAEPGAWYFYMPPSNGTILVNTCGTKSSSGLDTVLSIHPAANPTTFGLELALNDDYQFDPFDIDLFGTNAIACDGPGGSPLDSAIAVDVIGGQGIYIRVSRFDANSDGDFMISFDPNPAFEVTITATPPVIDLGGISTLGWFAPTADSCTASVGWTGGRLPSGLENVAPAVSTSYTLQCFRSGFSPLDATAIVSVDEVANDECTNPDTIPSNAQAFIVTDTTDGTAGNDPDTSSCSFGANGVTAWYEFTPGATRLVTLSTIGSDYDTVVSVWLASEGCGTLTTKVGCNDDEDDGFSVQSELTFMAQQGTDYLIQVGSYNGGPGGRLLLAVPEPSAGAAMVVAMCTLAALRRRRLN